MKIPFILVSLTLTSCASNYYKYEVNDTSATVSFSNLSPEIPEINIISNCISKKISAINLEKRNPNNKSKNKITIAADKIISFNYKYFWISGESLKLVASGNAFHQNIKPTPVKEIQTCSEVVTFMPENGKHYEVYFGKDTKGCVIKASEAHFDESKNINVLYKIQKLNTPKC